MTSLLAFALLAGPPAWTDLEAGGDHTCALRSDGRVACWGRNLHGQLGDGGKDPRTRPAWVAGLDDAVELTAAGDATCARRRSGHVVCWGICYEGQCGADEATMHRPNAIAGLTDARGIEHARQFACAIRADGSLACWGTIPGGPRSLSARPISGPRDLVGLAGGHDFLCAWTEAGEVWCLGKRYWEAVEGPAADPEAPLEVPVPVRLDKLRAGRGLAADWTSLCAHTEAGGVRCFDGRSDAAATALATGVAQIEVGLFHACARLDDGAVHCWGERVPEPAGKFAERRRPAPVPGAAPAVDLAVGTAHACALRRDGRVVCWGENRDAQLGDGTWFRRTEPNRVEALRDTVALAAASHFTCALGRDGRARCVGEATCGDAQPIDFPVEGLKDLAATGTTFCGRRGDGTLACRRWERGAGWQRMDFPADLGPLAAFALGDDHACGLRNGHVRCWGESKQGQLGSEAPDEVTAVPVALPRPALSLSAGDYHTCARLEGGEVWCWGLLTGYVAQPLRRITGIAGAEEIASGDGHVCARGQDGAVLCFGDMGYGEQFLEGEEPKEIKALRGVRGLAGGTHVTCGVRDGQVLCWGENGEGQLGDGTRAERARPVTVKLPVPAATVAVGFRHACATDSKGDVWCWGENSQGQLGDGRPSWCGRPVEVTLPGR